MSEKLVFMVAEIDSLKRASGRVIPRVEEQNNIIPAFKIGQLNHVHISVRKRKSRRVLSYLQHNNSSTCEPILTDLIELESSATREFITPGKGVYL